MGLFLNDGPFVMAFSLAEKLESMSWLEMVLWIGLAMLTVSLIVLMVTRWGQVRPVSKCVVLSVFAHILFFCYAYGTHFHFAHGSWGGNPLVKVSYIASDDAGNLIEEVSESASASTSVKPETPSSEPVVPEKPVPDEVADKPKTEPEPPAPTASPAPPMLLPEPRVVPPPLAQPRISETAASNPPPLLPDAEKAADEAAPTPSSPAAEENAASAAPPEVQSSPVAEVASTPASTTQPAPTSAAEAAKSTPSSDADRNPRDAAPHELAADVDPPALRPVDRQPLPEPYRLRGSPNRLRLAMPYGASPESESAVAAALNWLAAHQQSDGRWDASFYGAGRETKTLGHDRRGAGETADTGITGLALLAFLGGGHTHVEGLYRDTVQNGLQYLMREQQPDGSLVGQAKLFEKMYCHGIATLAVGEAYAMTGDTRLLACLRKAIQYTLAAQDKVTGGWRYQPGDRGDMSQFGWQVMTLRSAQLGGLDVPTETKSGMIKFMASVSQGQNGGLASYRSKERVSRTMTAEALCCRHFLDEAATAAAVREAHDFIMQELPGEAEPNLYYWYYATLALFQAQDADWANWNDALQNHLISTQRQDEALAGSWDTRDVWGGYGGRIYTTAMATLCLEVYYRYLPIIDPEQSIRRAKADTPDALRR